MRKILLIIIDQLGVGGAERQLSQLLPRINRDKCKIIVYTLFSKGECAEQLSKNNIQIITPPGYRLLSHLGIIGRSVLGLLSLCKLALLMFRYKPALIHYYLPRAYLFGSLCTFLTPKSKLLMSRRSLNNYQKKHPKLAIRERKLHRKMSIIFANSKAIFSQLSSEENVPEDRLKLIYNGVDIEKFNLSNRPNNFRKKLNISENSTVFIMVANLFSYKGHVDLLQALDIAKKELPKEWKLLCVGRDSGQKEKLLHLTKKYALDDNIYWLGEQNNIPELLSISNIALLCSHEEGFSNSILEAMASSLPLIVTDVGGNPEAVTDGVTGIIVPPKDPEQLSKALIKLSTSLELQKQMGDAGFQRVQENFSFKRCAEQYETIYSELMA